jgi:hypothetical protein
MLPVDYLVDFSQLNLAYNACKCSEYKVFWKVALVRISFCDISLPVYYRAIVIHDSWGPLYRSFHCRGFL